MIVVLVVHHLPERKNLGIQRTRAFVHYFHTTFAWQHCEESKSIGKPTVPALDSFYILEHARNQGLEFRDLTPRDEISG